MLLQTYNYTSNSELNQAWTLWLDLPKQFDHSILYQAAFYKEFDFLYSDIDGVIKRANATEYGLASGVFTKDINKAMYVADNIDAGTVFVNTYNKTDVAAPFGGFKQSGFGKDLGQILSLFSLVCQQNKTGFNHCICPSPLIRFC